MLSLLNPGVWIAALFVLAATFGIGHHKGYVLRDTEMQAQIAKMNEEARDKERAMQAAANATANNLRKVNQDAQAQISRLNSDVATGAIRLSIATRSVQACPVAGDASGDRNQARAELDPAAAQSLVAITADGDAAIRQLNACIDFYNQVKGKQ